MQIWQRNSEKFKWLFFMGHTVCLCVFFCIFALVCVCVCISVVVVVVVVVLVLSFFLYLLHSVRNKLYIGAHYFDSQFHVHNALSAFTR